MKSDIRNRHKFSHLLFPNQLDRDNLIAPGVSLRLPRSSWQITAGGPVGRNHLLVLVTDAPRNFAHAGLKPAGPFSSADALAAQDIQRATSSENSAYGAAMLTIDEVD